MSDWSNHCVYGTGTRKLPDQEYHRDRPGENVDGFTPTTELRLPEGWAHTFIHTESLMRLLNPEARRRHPPGTGRFLHFMTEHGVAPPECGVRDEAGAWALKTKCALRSYCMYLNKGVSGLYYFSAYDRAPTGMGLLPPDLPELPADATFEQVATPPLRAIRGLTRAFAGSEPLAATTPLGVDVTALGAPVAIFDGGAGHPPLWHRDAFAFLPFQVSRGRYVVAVYVATYDATKPMAEESYRLTIRGVDGRETAVRLDDPVSGRSVPVRVVRRDGDWVELELTVVDYPRLLTLGR